MAVAMTCPATCPVRRTPAPRSRRQSECHLNERPHRLPQHRHARLVRKWQLEPASRRTVEREVVTADVDDAEQIIPALDGHPDLRSSLDISSSSCKHRKRTGSFFVVIVSHSAHSSSVVLGEFQLLLLGNPGTDVSGYSPSRAGWAVAVPAATWTNVDQAMNDALVYVKVPQKLPYQRVVAPLIQ